MFPQTTFILSVFIKIIKESIDTPDISLKLLKYFEITHQPIVLPIFEFLIKLLEYYHRFIVLLRAGDLRGRHVRWGVCLGRHIC